MESSGKVVRGGLSGKNMECFASGEMERRGPVSEKAAGLALDHMLACSSLGQNAEFPAAGERTGCNCSDESAECSAIGKRTERDPGDLVFGHMTARDPATETAGHFTTKEGLEQSSSGEIVGRFAPTPSARLHLGNLMCAMVAWLSAKSRGGQILLRVEDLDAARCPFMGENTKWLLDDLAYFGLVFDGEPLYQSARFAVYETYFKALKEKGLLYPCYCSRAELHAASAPHLSDGAPLYDRRCLRRFLSGEPAPVGRAPAWRLRVPDETVGFEDLLAGTYAENLERDCSDFVVRRSDGVYAYQLAVVVDDGLSGVTEVVRGNDLLTSTPRQMYLQRLLGFSVPEYAHIPLLVDAAGRRLSKREGDGCMDAVRRKYPTPEPVIGALAAALRLIPEPVPMRLQELLPFFDFAKLPRGIVRLPEGF